MYVYQNQVGFSTKRLYSPVRRPKGALEGLHEDPPDEVENAHRTAVRRDVHLRAATGCTGREVRRAHHSALGLGELQELPVPPDVVAGRQHVHSRAQEVFRHARSDPQSTGGVLPVRDGELNLIAAQKLGEALPDGSPAGPAEDVADEQQIQAVALFSSGPIWRIRRPASPVSRSPLSGQGTRDRMSGFCRRPPLRARPP